MTRRGAVLLHNHVTGTGHHESWTALFAALLLERGRTVVCMTPDTRALRAALEGLGAADHPDLHLLPMPEHLPPSRTERLQAALNTLADLACQPLLMAASLLDKTVGWLMLPRHQGKSVQVENPEALETHGIKRVLTSGLSLGVRALRLAYTGAQWIKRRFLAPDLEPGMLHPRSLVHAARQAMRHSPARPALMISMYQDVWRGGLKAWSGAGRMPVAWAGVRFMPWPGPDSGRQDGTLRDPRFKGYFFLDQAAVDAYAAALPGLRFAFIPDVTNTTLPQEPTPLAQDITRRAAGRNVALLCGSIEGRKNLGAFCRMALRADPERWFFAVVGAHIPASFSAQDREALDAFERSPHGNTLNHDAFLPEEAHLNAVIAASDVVFAVYKDFRISSNMPTKAASFGKPILVSGRHLMGSRVRHYGTGLTVDEDDEDAMLNALERLAAEPIAPERFAAYRADFCPQALARALDRGVAAMLGEAPLADDETEASR